MEISPEFPIFSTEAFIKYRVVLYNHEEMELSIAAAGTPEDSPLRKDGNSHEVRGP